MAGQLLLVNPRKRRRTKVRRLNRNPDAPRKKRQRRSAAQKAAAFGGRVAKRTRRSAARTARKVSRAATKYGRRAGRFGRKLLRGGRRSKRKVMSVRQMVTNPASFVRSTVLPAGIGAAGALALDMAYAYLPIPANLKTGPLAPVVKIGAVGLIGSLAAHFAPQRSVRFVHSSVTAAITVIAYGFLKAQLQNMNPNLRLGEFVEDDIVCPIPGVTPLSYYQAGQFIPGINEYVSGDMNEYISGPSALEWTADDDSYSDVVS